MSGLFRATLCRPRRGAHRSGGRFAAPGCGGTSRCVRRRRVRSIREGARRPVPGGPCGGWRGGRVGPAAVGPNFLSARLNPGEAAAVLCKRAVRKGAEFLMLLGETVRRRGMLCGQESRNGSPVRRTARGRAHRKGAHGCSADRDPPRPPTTPTTHNNEGRPWPVRLNPSAGRSVFLTGRARPAQRRSRPMLPGAQGVELVDDPRAQPADRVAASATSRRMRCCCARCTNSTGAR